MTDKIGSELRRLQQKESFLKNLIKEKKEEEFKHRRLINKRNMVAKLERQHKGSSQSRTSNFKSNVKKGYGKFRKYAQRHTARNNSQRNDDFGLGGMGNIKAPKLNMDWNI